MRKSIALLAITVALLAGFAAGLFVGREYERCPPAAVTPSPSERGSTSAAVKVYFARFDSRTNKVQLVQVPRRLPVGVQPLRGSMLALLQGPTTAERNAGLVSQIPAGTELLGVRIENRTAYVDFNELVEAGGGTLSMQVRLHQILYTATWFDTVDALQILINGRKPEAFGGEGIIIDSPLRRPAQMPEF